MSAPAPEPDRFRRADGVIELRLVRPFNGLFVTMAVGALIVVTLLPLSILRGRDLLVGAAIALPLAGVLIAALSVLWRRALLLDGSRLASSYGWWTSSRSIDLRDVVTGAQLRPFRTSPGRAGAPSSIVLFVSQGGRSERLSRFVRRRLPQVQRDQLDEYESCHGALRVFEVPVRELGPERAAVALEHLRRHVPDHLRETARAWS